MIKYFMKAFRISNESIILATPLVLFLFLLSIYLGIAKNAPVNFPSLILLIITLLLMVSAFFAGWFYMVKRAVDLDKMTFIIDEDKAKASLGLLKELTAGIGEYFLSFLGASIFYFILVVLLGVSIYKFGMHTIGDVGIKLETLKLALNSTEAMKSLISSLSVEQLTKLNAWNLLIFGAMALFSFMTMFWAPQVIVKTKNPVIAFFKSIAFTFKHFLPSVIIFVYISFINFVVSLINAVAVVHPLVYFLSMLVYFYFIVYVVVLIFLYYDSQNRYKIEDNSNSGTDSIRKEQSGDSESPQD